MVKGRHDKICRFIHNKYDKGQNECGNSYYNSASLELLPCRPRHLMHEFIIGLGEKSSYLVHDLSIARVEGLEPSANGFGDHYSTN